MSKRQSVGIAALLLAVVALAAYGIYTTARIRTLEQRLGNAEERLLRVEADRQPRVNTDQVSALQAKLESLRSQAGVTPFTNGGFLFDGVRPHDPAPPWALERKRLKELGGPVDRRPVE